MVNSVPVLVPLPLETPFDYALAGDLRAAPGDLVEVPFGSREVIGVVWDAGPGEPVPAARLKPVGRRLDAPPLPPPLRRLIEHVAATTLAPLGGALKLVLSVPAALEPPVPKLGLVPAEAAGTAAALSAPRRRVLAALGDRRPRAAAEIARLAGVGAGVVQAMARAGLLTTDAAAGAGGSPAPARRRPRAVGGPVRGRGRARPAGRRRAPQRHPARGGPGRRQDRSLSRGGGRGPGARPPGADPAAGDRAHRPAARALRPALRPAAGGLAFRARRGRAPADLAADRARPRAGRDRRPLGAVPAVSRARPDRGRRGARPELQAGGWRRLSGPRHGGCPRAPGGMPGDPGVRDPGARDRLADGPDRRRPSRIAPTRAPTGAWPGRRVPRANAPAATPSCCRPGTVAAPCRRCS